MVNDVVMTPVERFAAFFAAEVDGDRETADRLAREMVEIDGVDPAFLEQRERARQRSGPEEGSAVDS